MPHLIRNYSNTNYGKTFRKKGQKYIFTHSLHYENSFDSEWVPKAKLF